MVDVRGVSQSGAMRPEGTVGLAGGVHASGVQVQLVDHRTRGVVSGGLSEVLSLRLAACVDARKPWFDAPGARAALRDYKLPALFVDGADLCRTAPPWKGIAPGQPVPCLLGAARLSRTGKIERRDFVDLSGRDPSRAFARALIEACGERGPVIAYGAAPLKERLQELAARIPPLSRTLHCIAQRVVDLLPIAQAHYCHPALAGGWGLAVLVPTIWPELNYPANRCGGLDDTALYVEALDAPTPGRKAELRHILLDRRAGDVLAIIKLWQFFAGRADLVV